MCSAPGGDAANGELAVSLYDPGMRVGLVADAGKRRGDGVGGGGVVAVGDAARPDFAREVVDTGVTLRTFVRT